MKTSVVVHSAALTPGNNAKALREGSSVYVRVLKNNGNGSYKVSFAGGSFDIRSSVPLEVGSSFKAGISLAGSRVILKMQGADIQKAGLLIQKSSSILQIWACIRTNFPMSFLILQKRQEAVLTGKLSAKPVYWV